MKRIKVYSTRRILDSETQFGTEDEVIIPAGLPGYLRAFSEYENYVTVQFEGKDYTIPKDAVELDYPGSEDSNA